ncbi:MAG: hypothetical protein K6G50_10170 [bacterium]|nr:hypothetical protein [bacterium]
MKKSDLEVIEKPLDIKQYEIKGVLGSVTVSGVWKRRKIEIIAGTSLPFRPCRLVVKMGHSSTFPVEIKPGTGFVAKNEPVKLTPREEKEEKEAVRPWRVKLTAEEQALIDKRREGKADDKQEAPDKYAVVSVKPEEASSYIESRTEAIDAILSAGFSAIYVEAEEVRIVHDSYDLKTITPAVVTKYLENMIKLLVKDPAETK